MTDLLEASRCTGCGAYPGAEHTFGCPAFADQRRRQADEERGHPQRVADAFRDLLLDAEGVDDYCRDGLAATPERAARAWRELTRGYHEPPPVLTTFEANHDEVVVVAPIPFFSLCEHHVLPFHGRAFIAYLPGGRILGLSKFARVVDHFARRLQVQERLTTEVADFLEEGLSAVVQGPRLPGWRADDEAEPGKDAVVAGPRGLAVVVRAEHLCMSMRGAQVPGAITTTSVMRGAFRDKPDARAEVLSLMGVAS